jgi:hypothetical protein
VAEATADFAALMARLEAAPFQNRTQWVFQNRTAIWFFSKL